ncbi:MAG: hypothetical protein KDD25_08460 [Bdellovibrionales bacterium]|nr:hypothetical protein [Bdellovibrionales bacterium]
MKYLICVLTITTLPYTSNANAKPKFDPTMTQYSKDKISQSYQYAVTARGLKSEPCPPFTREEIQFPGQPYEIRTCIMVNELGFDYTIPGWPSPLTSGVQVINSGPESFSVEQVEGGISNGLTINIREKTALVVSYYQITNGNWLLIESITTP